VCQVAHCKRCSASDTCTECKSDFYLLGSGSTASCVVCGHGYYTTSGTCNSCSDHCRQCSSDTACDFCEPGYYLSGANSCILCDQSGERRYTENYIYKCSTCVTGCSPDKCVLDDFCDECEANQVLTPATRSACAASCSSGFTSSEDICYSIECTDHCSVCESRTQCTTCETGYYKTSSKTCAKCSDNCNVCTSFSSCTTCASTYEKNGGFCYGCSSVDGQSVLSSDSNVCNFCSVLNCKSCAASAATCSECKSGFYLLNNACVTCGIGYKIEGLNCISCLSNCLTCTDASTCAECQQGYYLKSTACDECTAEGWRRGLDGSNKPICTQCAVTNCKTCTSTDKCLECTSTASYVLFSARQTLTGNTVCSTCSDNSNQFQQTTTKYCYDSNSCTSNCVKCESETLCATCDTKYYLTTEKLCVKCPETCSTCVWNVANSGYIQCTACESSNYLTSAGKACVPCTENGVVKENCNI
jgi:hypothetical protein